MQKILVNLKKILKGVFYSKYTVVFFMPLLFISFFAVLFSFGGENDVFVAALFVIWCLIALVGPIYCMILSSIFLYKKKNIIFALIGLFSCISGYTIGFILVLVAGSGMVR